MIAVLIGVISLFLVIFYCSIKKGKEKRNTPTPEKEYVLVCSAHEWPQYYKKWRETTLDPCQSMFDFWVVDKIIHQGENHYISVSWERGED